MVNIENIVHHIDIGDPQKRGEVGRGPNKLTSEVVALLRPSEEAIDLCGTSSNEQVVACAVVTSLSIENIPTHADKRRHKADSARRIVCATQRVCPVSNHLKEGERVELPCAKIRKDLEEYLGKI